RVLASTSVDLTSSHTPSDFGEKVLFTATITPEDAATFATPPPTPKVHFTYDDDGTVRSQDVAVDVATGKAVFDPQALIGHALTIGTHHVTARFLGDNNLAAQDALPVDQVVNKALTTTVVKA